MKRAQSPFELDVDNADDADSKSARIEISTRVGPRDLQGVLDRQCDAARDLFARVCAYNGSSAALQNMCDMAAVDIVLTSSFSGTGAFELATMQALAEFRKAFLFYLMFSLLTHCSRRNSLYLKLA